ncbi:hypothetical protein BGX27_008997 [Mortierella sp. AM989]|nr:hypothetical protein BGX27_008997 [Mortierella sp. AM989]
MSNPRQDEVDAFFNAIDATHQPLTSSSSSPVSSSPVEEGLGRNRQGSPSQQQQQQQQQESNQQKEDSNMIFTTNASATSPIPPPLLAPMTISSPSLSSPLSSGQQQPGMSPAIQKGSVSLGLALGGSGFRRKPLFEADDAEEGVENSEGLAMLVSGNTSFKKNKKKGKDRAEFENLTRSEFETMGDSGRTQDYDNEGEEGEEEEEEEEEDANSETPLQPQDNIRGLENQPESGRTKTNSFLSRLGVAVVGPSASHGMGGSNLSSGLGGNTSGGSSRNNSPRIGMGPFFGTGSRVNSKYSGKLFFPRPSFLGQQGRSSTGFSSASGQDDDGGGGARGNTGDGSFDHDSGSPHDPSPIYPGGMNPYHDDAVDWVVEGTGMRVAYDDFGTIDWIHDFAQERQRIRKMHRIPGLAGQIAIMYDWAQGWVVVLAVGIAAGIVAGGSDIASQWLGDIKEGYCDTAFYLNKNFCCWGFDGSGIPEVKTILGGFVIRHYLGLETLVIKTVTLVLSTSAGLSLGKEGPLLHISCCIGNILPRIFPKFKRNEAKMREIISAAASAGISVAFGAPIGGVVFSLEEMSYYFSSDTMWHSFFCAMAAAVALKLMDPFRTEKLVVFQVSYDRDWHGFEMFFYLLLGILGGLWGAFFIRMNLRLAAFRKTSWLRLIPIYEVFAVCLLTAAVGYLNIFTRVQSPQLLANLFRECDGGANYHGLCDEGGVALRIFSLLTASSVKGVLTILTFGLAIPAGIFMPSMVIGALFGRALGILVQAWQANHPGFWIFAACQPDVPCVTPGSYAMVGAAAFMGGVTRMTVSLVIIMFELTGALTYVLPIMIVVMTSKWVGDAFGKEGIFDGIILLCGYPFLDDKEEYKLNTTASQVMTPVEDLVVVTATGNTLDSLDNLLHDTHYKGYPVVSSLRDMMLVGYISRTELRYAIDEARKRNLPGNTPAGNVVPILENTPAFIEFRLWMDQTPITVSHRFPMDQVIVIFRRLGVRYVLCTQHGQLLGLITKKDVLKHLASIEHPEDQETSS